MGSFKDLPTEMQLKIFSYLTLEDICETVLPVCVDDDRIEQLAYDALIRNEVTFYKKWVNHVSISKYGRVLEKKSAVITRVIVCHLEKTHLPILNYLPSLSRLTTLKLRCHFFHYNIYSLVSKCIHLNELWLHITPGYSDMFSHLLSSLPHLTRLSVYLWGECAEVDQCLHLIAHQAPLLQRLHINTNILRDGHLETLLLRHSVSLTHMKLNSTLYTNQAIEMISQCPHLESLSIEDCHRIHLLHPLKCLSHLTSLHLCRLAHIPIQELECLFLSLPELTYLRLENVYLSEQMFINMSPKLKTLIVICCSYVNDPIIAALLTTCRQLQHVILYTDHQLTPDGIEKLSMIHLPIVQVKNTSLCRGNIETPVLDTWFDDNNVV